MIKKYSEWISEALSRSQYKEYVSNFNKDMYADLFKSYDGDHDRNYYRIYLPVKKNKSETQIEIESLLSKYDYEVIDYIGGKAKFNGAKNISRIGQVLQRIERNNPHDSEICKKLSKKFIEDSDRKAGDDTLVCISRHPYDIAGSDTDRNWSNCLTIASTDTKRYKDHISKIKKELSKVNLKELNLKIRELLDNNIELLDDFEIEVVDSDIMNDVEEGARSVKDELKKNDIQVDDDLLVKFEDEDGLVETDDFEFNELANKYNSIITLLEDINKFTSSGTNSKYIMNHIKGGVLMSYLIRNNDRNITDPIANLDIKPYYNIFDKTDIFLLNDIKMYGHGTIEYKKAVEDWLKIVNKGKCGIYRLADGMYNDNLQNKTIVVRENGYVMRSAAQDETRHSYEVDEHTLKLYSDGFNNIKTEQEAKDYIHYVISMLREVMSCGDIRPDILLSTPERWKKYFKLNKIDKGWK